MAVSLSRLYRTFPVHSKLNSEAPGEIRMEEQLSWLAEQVERAILKESFLVLAMSKAPTSTPATGPTYF